VNEETLFHLALGQPNPAARAAFLDRVCAGQPELRARLDKLLQAHEQPASLLEKPAPAEGATIEDMPGQWIDPASVPRLTEGPGTLIGPYKLLQQIGEGGMGVVFMAEQEQPVQRRVALKIIKPGLDSRQVIARLEAERQALALMDHPNIARFLDAGATAQGRPYFVMELVKGIPITKYCDEHHLTPRNRLELFVPVCQAVQHAHQKGIIHRDLKPSNILVGLYDGQPVPKVIDFGVAKATGRKLTERTLFTEFGVIVGTLEYMSPEQAQLDNVDIDTRSDIYSLGVLLYQLLTGTTPLQRKRLRQAALLEALRLIREEEPPRPSTRLSTTEELPSIAANRGIEPRKLSVLLRGELDWIVMKALEKDRGRRYETANGLATDLKHYLTDEPVQACPPSAFYRLRRFARRNRAAVGTAILVALALVTGTGVALWQAAQASKSAETARQNESDALVAKANLEDANKDLKQARDEVETILARSLLRPLARQPGPFTEPEVGSLWELTGSRSETLWKRFVEQALRDPMTTRQMKTRAEFALHAAVGLDSRKRLKVERLLSERLQDPTLKDGHRGDLALIAVSLGGLTPTAKVQVAQTLIEALGKGTDPSALRELAEALSALAARMEPKEAARDCSQAARILSQILTRSTYAAFEPLAQGLSALAARMEPQETVRVCSRAAATITRTLAAQRTTATCNEGTEALWALAPHVDPEQAAKTAAFISGEIGGVFSGSAKHELAELVALLAARMEAEEAARVCAQAAARLSMYIKHTEIDGIPPESLVKGLRALAPHLKHDQAAKVAGILAEEMVKVKGVPRECALLASGLAALAPHLESREVAKIWAILAEGITKPKNYQEYDFFLRGLYALGPHMDPKEAARLYSPALYSHLVSGSSRLIEGLSVSALRMKNQDATVTLLQAMATATHPSELRGFAETLSRIAARMERKEAARVCSQAAAILTGSMAKKPNNDPGFAPYALANVAKGIAAIAPYLEDKEASRLCSQVIASLSQTLANPRNRFDYTGLAEGLTALATHMNPNEATQAAVSIHTALTRLAARLRESTQSKNDDRDWGFEGHTLVTLANALSTVAGRLEPKAAAHVCAQAPEILIEALIRTHHFRLAMALSDVAARLEPEEAARVCAQAASILVQAIMKYPGGYGRAESLAAVAARMEPKKAAVVCAQAAAILTESMITNPRDRDILTQGLSTVLTHGDQRERSRRLSAVFLAIGLPAGSGHSLATACVLLAVREPLPCLLSPQELVELLKHPTCVGQARRIILDQLESHYKHAFADHWAFVRYAQEQHLDLDLTTPPTLRIPSTGGERN
jgi:serine/threonine protein kinase